MKLQIDAEKLRNSARLSFVSDPTPAGARRLIGWALSFAGARSEVRPLPTCITELEMMAALTTAALAELKDRVEGQMEEVLL